MSDDRHPIPPPPDTRVRRATGALSERPLARAVLVLFSGDAMSQALLLFIAPIVTRLYTPEQFGVATVYAAFLAVAVVVSALRYEFAVPVAHDDDTGVNVLAAATIAAVGMGVLGTVGYLAIAALVEILGDGLPLAVAPLFGLSLLLNGTLLALGGWMIRGQRYAMLARSRIARTGSQAMLQVGLGWAGWGALGLVTAALVGTAIGVAVLAGAFLGRDLSRLSAVSGDQVRSAFGRFRRFPAFSGPAAFVQAATVELPYVVFGTIFARGDVGAMGLARRTLGTPLYTLSGAVGEVFFGHGSELARTDPNGLHRFVRRMTFAMTALFVPLGIGAFVVLPPLTTSIFGDDWAAASDFIRVMVPMFVFQAIAAPTGHVLDILERQDLHLVRDLIRLAIGLSAVGLILLTDPGAVTAMLLYVLFAAAGSVVYVMTSLSAIARHRATTQSES